MHPDVEAFSTYKGSELPYPVVQAHQVHGDRIAVITDPGTTREQLEGYDALVTDRPGIAIGARSADCVPILMYDPVRRVAAAVHSGWRGTVIQIGRTVVNFLHDNYGCNPSDIVAVICPCIGPESFQVGEEVVEAFAQAGFPMDKILIRRGERIDGDMRSGTHIDLWKANRWILTQAGIPHENIQTTSICTYLNHDKFMSARYEAENKCERIINTIRMRE